MLLANLERIHELDEEIVSLQQDLTHLYGRRSALIKQKIPMVPGTVETPTPAQSWYEKLSEEWLVHGYAIPSFKTLRPKIQKAISVRNKLSDSLGFAPELFTLVLIPSERLLDQEALNRLRVTQEGVLYSDQRDMQIDEKPVSGWRLLVVYDGAIGLAWGSAASIINDKKYQIDGMDTRALGVREYSIYLLQQQQPIDNETWVWLLKHDTAQPVAATFMSGAYRFSNDDPRGYLQTERFRPAVEIA